MEREITGFEGYTHTCCNREDKTYHVTVDDPLAQICNECKFDEMVKKCIRIMDILDTSRRLQVITEFLKKE